jgi:teichuronic acid biosynthesis glycosyltransferase TuaC
MLRVLALSTLFPDASRPNFGIFVEQKLRALASREGVSLCVVAPVGIPPWPLSQHPRYRALSALPTQEEWRGLQVHRPRFVNVPGTSGRFHAAMIERALVPLLADLDFDLITAEFLFPDGPAAVALGKRFGVPVSLTARGADVHHWAHQPAVRGQILHAAQSAAAIVTVSEALGEDLVALGIDAAKIHPVANGVDFTRFPLADRAAAKAALGVEGPLVASIGALIPRKGHDIVIQAVASLPGVALRIAGDGPERPRLEALIARLGLADRAQLLGPVAHADLPPLLAAADVMALASSSEGLANVWLEALASGTPLAIPAIGGARQVVRSPDTGRLAARTPQAFAEAIAALLAAPPDRASVRAEAAPFTWEANSSRIMDIFQNITDRRPTADRFVAAA